MTKPELLKVGEIARLVGKTVRAIRYYEELGLLRPVSHTKGGFRLFAREDVKKVDLIDKFHSLGFSLEEIAAVVQAYRRSASGDAAAVKLEPLLRKTMDQIQRRMSLMDLFRREVAGAIQFIGDCFACRDVPAEDLCGTCRRGEHKAALPQLIECLVK